MSLRRPYAQILEKTRAVLETQTRHPFFIRLLRGFAFSWLLPKRWVRKWVFAALGLGQRLGLMRLAAAMARRKWLPGRLGQAAMQAPALGGRSFRSGLRAYRVPGAQVYRIPARGKEKHRVALFTGCVADHMFAEVNHASVDVLTRNGCTVDVLEKETCCGALHIHNGARDAAIPLADSNIEAFCPAPDAASPGRGPYDAIVSNAAGCSAELRHYSQLTNHARAKGFESKVRDISEFLVDIGFRKPGADSAAPARRKTLAYDEPCHLLHAQKISAAPKAILDALPDYQRVPLTHADTCCGSAGVYSLVQPELAGRILDDKTSAIAASQAEVVATGNPGCLLQIRQGVQNANLGIRVEHPVVLLAEAYAAYEPT